MSSIATICFSHTVGGLELAVLRRGSELAAHGHRVLSVVPDSAGLLERARALGLPAFTVVPRFEYVDPLAARRLRALLDQQSVDTVLVARTRDLSTVLMAAGPRRRVVLYQQMQSGLNKRDWFHNRIYRRLDACIAITERARQELITTTAMPADRIVTIPYPIDTQRFSPEAVDRCAARRAMGLPENSFVVGMVGGFNPGKGQREFLEALRLIAVEDWSVAENLHARIIGLRPADSSRYASELERARRSLLIADHVAFLPFTDDTRSAYAAMDVFVLASHCETFGMVLQEAMAMGVATVGTDCGGVPEIVRHEHTGLLVPPKSARAIADAILRLAHDPALRTRLSEAGRAFTVAHYDPVEHYRRFEAAVTGGARSGKGE